QRSANRHDLAPQDDRVARKGAFDEPQQPRRDVAGLLDDSQDLGALDLLLARPIEVRKLDDAGIDVDRAPTDVGVALDLNAHVIDEAVAALVRQIGQPVLHLAAEGRDEIGEDDHILRVEDDLIVVWDDDALDGDDLIGFHRTLQAPADLGWLHRSPKNAPDGILHHALKEALEAIKP